MASAGTLLSDLGEGGPQGGADGDLVQKILQDMNAPTQPHSSFGAGQRPPPPPMPQQQPIYQQQMAGSTSGMTMDANIPTSHIIGNEHPTPADFAAAMTGMSGQRPSEQRLVGMPGAYTGPQQQMPQIYQAPTKNFYSRVLEEVKVPFVVTLLFFLFSLPPIRVLIAHYIPSLIRPTGDFTMLGLGAVAAIVGLVFWILQRIIAPLLSF